MFSREALLRVIRVGGNDRLKTLVVTVSKLAVGRRIKVDLVSAVRQPVGFSHGCAGDLLG